MYNYRMVTDDLYWVGADEHRLALFENIHPLYHGVSYNAYVLLDEKTVLFDTAAGGDWKIPFDRHVSCLRNPLAMFHMALPPLTRGL